MSSSFLDSLISALLKVAFLIVWAVQGSVLTVCAAFWTEHTHAQTHTHISTQAPGSQHTSSESSSGQILQMPACLCTGSSFKGMIYVSSHLVLK